MALTQDNLESFRGVEKAADDTAVFRLFLRGLQVGKLSREEGNWVFEYTPAFREQSKVSPIRGFPDVHRVYRSPNLWPFFVLRVPSLSQVAVQRFMEKRKLTTVDEATLLKEFGRRSISNPFELIPA